MGEPFVPKEVFFTDGVGKHRTRLQSFELALRDADIEVFNLVRVSSIFPPHCKVVSRTRGLPKLQPGQIVHVVLAEAGTKEAGTDDPYAAGLPPEMQERLATVRIGQVGLGEHRRAALTTPRREIREHAPLAVVSRGGPEDAIPDAEGAAEVRAGRAPLQSR